MKSIVKLFIVLALFPGVTLFVRARSNTTASKQPSPVHRRLPKKNSNPSIEAQIQQMRDDLQSQIDELKLKLATKDKQIEALKTQTLNTQQTTATAATRIHEIVNMGHPTAISQWAG
jgi:uncharacterized protein HemX